MQILLYELRKSKGLTQKNWRMNLGYPKQHIVKKKRDNVLLLKMRCFSCMVFSTDRCKKFFYQDSHQNGNTKKGQTFVNRVIKPWSIV